MYTKKYIATSPLHNSKNQINTIKSKTSARVVHVFGFMEQSMDGSSIRSVGIVIATGIIGLINLTYNIFRYGQVNPLKPIRVSIR